MSGSNKHAKTAVPSDRDLKSDPGIDRSKGSTMAGKVDESLIDGDHTELGDVGNDARPDGGVDPKQTGRTNR